VDIDEKKTEIFMKGLSAQLQERLVLFHNLTFNALVSASIDQEDASQAYLDMEEEEKRAM
jgi:L-ribulose-5-phosphate 3-epimerase UlaE